jgi:hypothetical protein
VGRYAKPILCSANAALQGVDTLRRFGQSFFWFMKWVVAPIVLGALVIAGAVLLSRQAIDFATFLNYFALVALRPGMYVIPSWCSSTPMTRN